MAVTSCPFRAVGPDENGIEFEHYLWDRIQLLGASAQQSRELFRRVWAFVQEYDHLRDELRDRGQHEEPSVSEYAERWRMSERSAYRAFEEFALVMPELGTAPGPACDELWNGISRQAPAGHLMALADVRVREISD